MTPTNSGQRGHVGHHQLINSDPAGLSHKQLDRAAGVLLGAACGDALGVPYEFASRLGAAEQPAMIGGGLGPYQPGEYSDDTQMAVCIAQVAATGASVYAAPALDAITANFLTWLRTGASDVGAQTRSVLSALTPTDPAGGLGVASRDLAAGLHQRTGRTAGNGSLMRTGIIALAYLNDPAGLATAARAVSDLTHHDPLAGDACVLWCFGIRRAVLDATWTGISEGVTHLPQERRGQWRHWLSEAEGNQPRHFSPNGYVVAALQAAWSAIRTTPVPYTEPGSGTFACQHFQHALAAAVRAGHDTDTVAAIAGAMLGAYWGASAVPAAWQRKVHGWPGMRADDLVRLAVRTAWHGARAGGGWPVAEHHPPMFKNTPFALSHPHDEGVVMGNFALATAATGAELGVDAIVSLCRTGTRDFSGWVPPGDHVRIWLLDITDANAHRHFVVDQAARAVAKLRAEGKKVLLHCAAGRSRTPAVAARYANLAFAIPPTDALEAVRAAAAPAAWTVNRQLEDVVYELAGQAPRARRCPKKCGLRPLW